MRRLAITVGIVLVALAAHADQPIGWNQNHQGHFDYNFGSPSGSPAPATSPELHGGHASVSVPVSQSGTFTDLPCSSDLFVVERTGGAMACGFLAPGSFGSIAGLQLLGNVGSSSGAPSFFGPGLPLQVPQVNAGGTALGFATLGPATTGVYATWSSTGVRVVAIDTTAGSDSNACWADSPDTTQANVAIATQAAGAKPCKTQLGAESQVPPMGNGHLLYVVEGGGGETYSESFGVWTALQGYSEVLFRGTATNSTAGSVAFSGSTDDVTFNGDQTCAGMNAAGYHPTTSATGQQVTLTKVGGGSPAFPASPAKPIYCRARFDVGSSQPDAVFSVVATSGGNQLTLSASTSFLSTDTIYLEEPGVVLSSTAAFAASSGTWMLAGLNTSANVAAVGSAVVFLANTDTNNVIVTSAGATVDPTATVFVAPFPTVGGARINGALTMSAGTFSGSRYQVGIVGNVNLSGPITDFDAGNGDVVGGDLDVNATAAGLGVSIGSNFTDGFPLAIGGTLNIGVVTGLPTAAASVVVNFVNLTSTTTAFGIVIGRGCNVSQFGTWAGGTKTTAGVDMSRSEGSQVQLNTDVPNNTVTGASGDIWWGNDTTTGINSPIYLSWAGLYDDQTSARSSGFVFPNGARFSFPSSAGQKSGQTKALTVVGNESGSSLTPRELIRANFTDGIRAVPAFADTTADVKGSLGVAQDTIPNGQSGFAVFGQQAVVVHDTTDTACNPLTNGGHEVYVSGVQSGTFTCTRPAIARTIGWTVGETTIQFEPENDLQPISSLYIGGTVQNTEPGLNLIFATGTPTFSDNPSASRTDVTFPSWLVDPGSNGLLARTALGTTVARTLTSSGATISVTNGSGVGGNPNVDLPNVGSAGSCSFCSVTFDAEGREAARSSGAVFGASGASHSIGLVPDPGASAGTTRFLREDATWQVVSTGGLADPGGNGIVVRTALNTTTARTLTSGGTINVTNGSGVSGNPSIDLPNVGPGAGTYGGSGISSVTLDAQGRVGAVGTATYLTGNQTITLTGDATGSGTTSIATTISGLALSKLATIGAHSWLANPTGLTASPTALSYGSSSGIPQIVVGSPDTVTVFAPAAGLVPYGLGSNGQLTTNADLNYTVASTVSQLAVGTTAVTNANVNIEAVGPTYSSIRSSASGGSNINLVDDGSTGPRVESHTNPDGTSSLAAVSTRVIWGANGFDVQSSPSTTAGTARTFSRQMLVSPSGGGTVFGNPGVSVMDFGAAGGLLTSATSGWLRISSMAGDPTGTPTNTNTNALPLGYDRTDHRIDVGTAPGSSAAWDRFPAQNNVGAIGWTSSATLLVPTAPTVEEYAITPASTAAASSMGALHQWDAVTQTRTGTTHTTSDKGFVYLPQMTVTDSSASTDDKISTLTVAGGPICSGSMTCTATPAVWVQSGTVEIDGLTANAVLKADGNKVLTPASAGDVSAALNTGSSTGILEATSGAYGTVTPGPGINYNSGTTTLSTSVATVINVDYFGGPPAGNSWLVTGDDTATKTYSGFAVEYPLGGVFTTSRLRCVSGINTGVGYTSMTLTITRNGSATAAAVTIPASSPTVGFDSGAVAISSGAATDTFGIELTYTGATVTSGATDFNCTASFQ